MEVFVKTMNFQFYLEKLFDSEVFKKFKEENKDAYFCSGFFSIDKKGKDNKTNLDYYVPSTKKWFSFHLDGEVSLNNLENYDERVPEKLSDNFDFDFNDVEKIILDKIEKEKINKNIEKILFSLQKLDGRDYLVCTVFITGLALLKINIALENKEITDFEKKSFFDMLKIIKKDK